MVTKPLLDSGNFPNWRTRDGNGTHYVREASAAGIKIQEPLRRYDEAGGAEGAGEAGGDISCSVISAFLH
ncbi:hypothetical protein [Coleofasciculus sp. F4-SAH-05]|uniref:hypothetical protein n=1 Tax=Coleofasciculus sp. F4-SAH-05 TaxID=3069525 RepID=UPI0032FE63C3